MDNDKVLSVRCKLCHRPADIIRPDQPMSRDDRKIFANDWGLCWDHYLAMMKSAGTQSWLDAELERRSVGLERRGDEPRSIWLMRIHDAIPASGYGVPFRKLLKGEYDKFQSTLDEGVPF